MYLYVKLHKEPTLADGTCDFRVRKIKKTFFTQINILIDWEWISKLIDKDNSRGKRATGNLITILKCVYYKIGID